MSHAPPPLPGTGSAAGPEGEAPFRLPGLASLALQEYRLRVGGTTWSVQHAGAVLSHDDEQRFLGERDEGHVPGLPYGVALWPSGVALAHDLSGRGSATLRDRRVLELGAGVGLPGIVAASFGGRVVQTDRQPLALALSRHNARRNGVADDIDARLADWTAWDDATRYDLVLGADVLYAPRLHAALRAIFDRNLAPGGRVLLADPFRAPSLELLETMAGAGWAVTLAKWTVGDLAAGDQPRSVGVYELRAPGDASAA